MSLDPVLRTDLQAQLAQRHAETMKTQALQHVLQVFAPEGLQSPADYLTLLDRVCTVLDDARAQATAPPAVVPSAREE